MCDLVALATLMVTTCLFMFHWKFRYFTSREKVIPPKKSGEIKFFLSKHSSIKVAKNILE